MTKDTLFGWDLHEWARAAGRYPGFPTTGKGGLELRTRCNSIAPQGIEGYEYPHNYEWAKDFWVGMQTTLRCP